MRKHRETGGIPMNKKRIDVVDCMTEEEIQSVSQAPRPERRELWAQLVDKYRPEVVIYNNKVALYSSSN